MNSEAAPGEVFNVGNPSEISINELAKLVKQKTLSSSPIQYIPYETAYEKGFEDMAKRVPDISKINRTTGFSPQTALPEILDEVIQFITENKHQTSEVFV